MAKSKQAVIILGILSFIMGIMVGCDTKKVASQNSQPYSLSIMTITHSGEPMTNDSPVKRQLEEYTNTTIEFIWVSNSTYEDKLNITLASGELPTLITVDQKTPSIINAAKTGLFWNIGPYLNEYDNLSQADPEILKSVSIDGNVYGVYRSRPVGRNGITYRKDWLAKLGLKELNTIEDFYKMLKAFTYDDPDGNGKQDTYGLAMSKYSVPWDIMSVWFGVPNQWGYDAERGLIPAHSTPQYKEALYFFRGLYREKLINQDFATLDSSMWMQDLKDGYAGVVVDVLDHARRLQEDSDTNNKGYQYDIVGVVSGSHGLRNLPTLGYSGFNVITKDGAKTEEEMKKALKFLDQLNDKEMQILLNNGIEGRHFRVEDDYAIQYSEDIPLQREKEGLNQLHMGIPEDLSYFVKNSPIRDKIQDVMTKNKAIIINNPAEGFTSNVWAKVGKVLDNIIEEARLKYIIGEIDEDGLDQAFELWKESGGLELIEEINQLHSSN